MRNTLLICSILIALIKFKGLFMSFESTVPDEGLSKGKWFVASPRTDEAVDNGVARLDVMVAPGHAPGFAVFVNHFPPLGGGPPTHSHKAFDEAFYVLSGQIEVCIDGETALVPTGSLVFVPRGTVHAFRNPSSEPATLLVVTTTPGAIDLILGMSEAGRSPETMQAHFAKHDSQVDGPPLG